MTDIKTTASMLGISEFTLSEWVKDKKIKSIKINEELFFTEEDIKDFIEKTGIKLITPESHKESFDSFFKTDIKDQVIINSDLSSDEQINEFLKKLNNENSTLSPEEIEKIKNNIK
ncbi:MAG TPA: helix-turn-helix domain-containing protein [Tepiditoga sp.]|nr:helix-turn-helix domain-containing protein [Thermotogota bacterium]HOO74421.1 helix-turn-helix domain-containing protein [Tepiditoga sp.]